MSANPYESPTFDSDRPIRQPTANCLEFWWLAAFLMLAGMGWGALCSLIILERPQMLLVFGPGYIVTGGFVWRTCFTCSVRLARVIWGLSAFVQGYWLVSLIIAGGLVMIPLGVWWLASCFLSIMGVIWDGPERNPSREVRI